MWWAPSVSDWRARPTTCTAMSAAMTMASNPRVAYSLAGSRPPLAGPSGKRIIVHVEINVETWPFDAAVPRALLPAPHGAAPVPDVPNFTWFEYGMRRGLPRIMATLAAYGVPASCALNAAVLEVYPEAAAAIRDAGWELIGHGVRQRTPDPATEADMIAECLDRLQAFAGKPIAGWLGPGLAETDATPDLLKAAGIRYVCDWGLDDVPCWMSTLGGPLIALPNTLDHDDALLYAVERQPSEAFLQRVTDTLATFTEEAEASQSGTHVLTLGLHPHLIGATHRMPYLKRALALLQARDDTVFMTGTEIADWFEATCPAP